MNSPADPPPSADPPVPDDRASLPEPLRSFRGLIPALAPQLRRVEAAHARYRAERAAGRVLDNSLEALRVELTYHSNAIEGSTLSLRETQLILEGFAPAGGKLLREIYEARNHDRALRLLERLAEDLPRALSVHDLLEIHAQILADIDPMAAGRFRSGRVLIRGTRFIPPGSHKFDELLPALLDLANAGEMPPALQAAELHYNLVAIHPFGDGNGRTARLLMNHHLLRHGYPLAIIEVGDRAEYLTALESANDGQCGPFAAFVLRSVERSILRLVGEAGPP